jgi:hypothetical protein
MHAQLGLCYCVIAVGMPHIGAKAMSIHRVCVCASEIANPQCLVVPVQTKNQRHAFQDEIR